MSTTGITCNAICPGWVPTPLVQKQIDDRAKTENIPAD
jgi:3-hydroxybutyrate dehydrogenase